MRTEQEVYDLILSIAEADERVRAVILNGSRVNPNAKKDIFQDFDVVYVVTDMLSFKADPEWIQCFGEMMILQLPDDMGDSPANWEQWYAYLMQFADGNRIDLILYPADKLDEMIPDSLSKLLLDKDGVIEPFPPADESSYLPEPPTENKFDDCCNEFWWISVYAAKGLWRRQIIYVKFIIEDVMRDQLMKMLFWFVGMNTGFEHNLGKHGANLNKFLDTKLWLMLEKTYSDADSENTWDAMFVMCDLFRIIAPAVGDHFGFHYPQEDDDRVSSHLRYIRSLPQEAEEMYP
jgi:aminoglycoside 6-adenylyltransferase